MKGLSLILFIIYALSPLCAADSEEIDDQHVSYYSRCVYPCSVRGATLIEFTTERAVNFSKDPRILESENNSTQYTSYCIERSGPFSVSGRTIDGVNEYACWKNQAYESDTISIFYYIPYKPYSGRPDICEVCNGQNMMLTGFVYEGEDCEIVIPKELGCNIPWFCPVVNSTTQTQCSICEPPQRNDNPCCNP